MGSNQRSEGTRRESLIRTVILYRLLETNEQISILTDRTDYDFMAQQLSDLHSESYLEIDRGHYVPTDKARRFMARLLSQIESVRQLEIFGVVRPTRNLTENESEPNEEGKRLYVFNSIHDPRFFATDKMVHLPHPEKEPGVEDLRLAMYRYLGDQMCGEFKDGAYPDPFQVVFLQKLVDGRLKSDTFWFDLANGEFEREVEGIVEAAVPWESVAGPIENYESEEARDAFAAYVMKIIYTAGMLEQRKRDGQECPGCHTPLAIFEAKYREENNGEPIPGCPNPECPVDFRPPPPDGDEYECPKCRETVYSSQSRCTCCGAYLDYSSPQGSVIERTTTHTEVEYVPVVRMNYYIKYGFTPCGYWDPFDPFVNARVIGRVYYDPWVDTYW